MVVGRGEEGGEGDDSSNSSSKLEVRGTIAKVMLRHTALILEVGK